MHRNIIIVRSPGLSRDYSPRYVVVDADTDEILDNAQGYGYRSAQKAHAAWAYKNRSSEKKQKEKRLHAWLKENKRLMSAFEDASFIAAKERDIFSLEDVFLICSQFGFVDLEWTPKQILKAWLTYEDEEKRKKRKKQKTNF